MNTESKTIWEKRHALEKERREFIRKATAEFDTIWYAKKRELHKECAETVGHKWIFSHLGPLNDPWFYCSRCGLSKVKRDDE